MRGQASVEQLTVYGFAIMIILGLVGLFVYLNSNTEQLSPSDCKFSSEISCIDFQVVSGAGELITIFAKNNDKKLYEVTLYCTYSNSEETSGDTIPVIEVGEEFQITCPSSNEIKKGSKVRIETRLKYHLNISSVKNWRNYRGSIVTKAK